MNLYIGDLSPKTIAKDHNRIIRSSYDLNNKSLVLFFYQKDNSPGSISQVCSFIDNFYTFKFLNSEIWVVNIDNKISHKSFSNKLSLPFTLISDKNHKIGKLFGVKYRFGFLNERITFVIDKIKKIRLIHKNLLDSNSHIKESIKILENILI